MSEQPHLSHIATQWSLVRRAHGGRDEDRLAAQQALLERYGGAVRRYLLAALRDQDAADEVFQDFALRFVRGDLRRADPDIGKFRGYLKTIIRRLVIDYHRRQQRLRRHEVVADVEQAPDPNRPSVEPDFVSSWRDDLLARAWQKLRDVEAESGRPLFSVLSHRVEHPQVTSETLASQLSERLDKPMTAGNARVWVHRARDKFAEFLLEEVGEAMEDRSLDRLEEELIELRLHDYCREALQGMRREA